MKHRFSDRYSHGNPIIRIPFGQRSERAAKITIDFSSFRPRENWGERKNFEKSSLFSSRRNVCYAGQRPVNFPRHD